jgi:hypothetical protein
MFALIKTLKLSSNRKPTVISIYWKKLLLTQLGKKNFRWEIERYNIIVVNAVKRIN